MKKKLHPIAGKLLNDIESFRARTGTSRNKFGMDINGDGFFIRRLEQGRMPRFDTIDRVYRYIDRRTKAVPASRRFQTVRSK